MNVYAHVVDGALAGFYAADIHKPPLPLNAKAKVLAAWHADPRPPMPEGVVAISDDDHRRWVADQTLILDGDRLMHAP
ncbi:hypothetical protein [Pseudochelatococcus contaminans]|uniref:Uncharacterized protein n=1 Tax=Pseudochelatococcus contaminans TaxID=1538103 RepID=A0A7W6EGQ0_9HYPH|nr:hypothetical protein [Pseudochelatococcus contaminans]MBB3809586.1 hypothetical protein [Pseudochelatococcus contaminans]